MITRTQAIKKFLTASTHSDLAELYNFSMECQVNVAQDGGSRVEGEFKGSLWHGWTNGMEVWKPIRIPRNANSTPEYSDTPMSFSLEQHAEGIGMTGWDWQKKVSRWVAFDFDAIAGHSEKHGKKVDDAELEAVKQAAQEIPWVTTRRSASGRGLHLYVFLDPVVYTSNHNEHAAVARAILAKMSALSKFDFYAKVDICGHNMWVWHRKMTVENQGLALLKKGVPLDDVPTNWKDHLKVVTGHRKKTLPQFIKDSDGTTDAEKFFMDLSSQYTRVQLDEEHKRHIKWFEEHKTGGWWDSDHHMLVTHTSHFKEMHEDLQLKGIFETVSKGKDTPSDINCFAFPMRRGAWVIRRYSMGASEAPSWDQDSRGWTRCFYNQDPTLASAAKSKGAVEDTNGSFVFKEALIAQQAAVLLGANIPKIVPALQDKPATLKPLKDGRVSMEIEGDDKGIAYETMEGWLFKGGKWKRIFNTPSATPTEAETGNYDDLIRHLVTETGEDAGWVLKPDGKEWVDEPLHHIKAVLSSMNLKTQDVTNIIGSSIMRAWRLVNLPFQPEYPGDRQWNRHGAQLKYVPTTETENLKYPNWLKILNHCGQGLDDAVANNAWAQANGLKTGADYLKIWIASLFKYPTEPLPYLFFYSTEQNTGKSIFHESLSLLLTRGYQRADQALINPSGFNAELAHAIICVVEEINLRKNKDALNRIKDWVTSIHLPIHEKGMTPRHVPNTNHFIQTANDKDFCPIFPGDTRITMIEVQPLDLTEMIPKREFLPLLQKEAPDFLAEILRLDIPPSNDRLNVPVISTISKLESEKMNRTPLQEFIEEKTWYVPGSMVSVAEFYENFTNQLDPMDREYWTKQRIGKEFPSRFPKGRNKSDAQWYYGNISLTPPDPNAPVKPKLKLVQSGGSNIFLVPETP